MAKRRGLGRGLDALIGAIPTDGLAPVNETGPLRELPLSAIRPSPLQPRRPIAEDSLRELADSIRAQGVVQPIVVRPRPLDKGARGKGPREKEHYELIAGERRWRASRLAGLERLPAIVRNFTDAEAACIALIENLQREDLGPLETARALARLAKDYGMTHERIARQVGYSRAAVTNILRLLELDEQVKELVERGQLDMGHARALLALPATQQRLVAAEAIGRQWPVRRTEQRVRELVEEGSKRSAKKPVRKRTADPDVRKLETELSERLAAEVAIRHGRQGRGLLQIRYASLEQLDGILQRIRR